MTRRSSPTDSLSRQSNQSTLSSTRTHLFPHTVLPSSQEAEPPQSTSPSQTQNRNDTNTNTVDGIIYEVTYSCSS